MRPGAINDIKDALAEGALIPYLGPRALELARDCPVPSTPDKLAALITSHVPVPYRIRNRLTAAAQFIENFKHRKTLTGLMHQYFADGAPPSALHRYLAQVPALPLVVDTWYDDAMQQALAQRSDWGQVQGLSQSEHFGSWYGWYDRHGAMVGEEAAKDWKTLLYKPLGGVAPADNFIVSDSDYVEVLTEIDIQTPVPARVRELRRGRSFLFLGCRFTDQLQRSFARQIMKRSSERHWAVLPDEQTRNEHRFLEEQNIECIAMPLEEFAALLMNE